MEEEGVETMEEVITHIPFSHVEKLVVDQTTFDQQRKSCPFCINFPRKECCDITRENNECSICLEPSFDGTLPMALVGYRTHCGVSLWKSYGLNLHEVCASYHNFKYESCTECFNFDRRISTYLYIYSEPCLISFDDDIPKELNGGKYTLIHCRTMFKTTLPLPSLEEDEIYHQNF